MICDMFAGNWSIGSWVKIGNVDVYRDKQKIERTPDQMWSERFSLISGTPSTEFKKKISRENS